MFKTLSQHEIEDILCIDVEDIEFSEVVKKRNQSGQEKKTLMMSSHLSFRVQEVDEGERTFSVPTLYIENAEYDQSQGECCFDFIFNQNDFDIVD